MHHDFDGLARWLFRLVGLGQLDLYDAVANCCTGVLEVLDRHGVEHLARLSRLRDVYGDGVVYDLTVDFRREVHITITVSRSFNGEVRFLTWEIESPEPDLATTS